MTIFHKTDAPATLAFEIAGLRWLKTAEPDGGAPVVDIVDEGEGWVDLVRLDHAAATSRWHRRRARGPVRPERPSRPMR